MKWEKQNFTIGKVSFKRRVLIWGIAILFWGQAVAQEKIKADMGADFVSGYICRGQDYGGVSIQPSLTLSYKGLSLNAWGSAGFESRDNKELDWTLMYEIGNLDIYITDYWISGEDNRYFDFKANSTPHVLETSIGYDFGFAWLAWSTMFAGADYRSNDGKRAYSSYLNLTVPFPLGGLNCTAELGATPWATSYYANSKGFSICVVGLSALKEIKISDSYTLPAYAKVIFNPTTNKAYLIFGLHF